MCAWLQDKHSVIVAEDGVRRAAADVESRLNASGKAVKTAQR